MKKIVLRVLQVLICCNVLTMNGQDLVIVDLQLGVDINGEGPDAAGSAVSINSAGDYLAIGAPENDGNGTDSGHVRIYRESSQVWSQRGSDIDGEAIDDEFGSAVSISDDGTIVAIGAPRNDGNGSNSGHVRVFQYSSGTWTQLGSDIDGGSSDSSGRSVSISSDGTILATNAGGNSRIYQYSSGTWTQVGSDITGGTSVSINSNGTTVATYASGTVRVYEYESGSWTQVGANISVSGSSSSSSTAVSINDDGSIVAIGSPNGTGETSLSGFVAVYQNRYGT